MDILPSAENTRVENNFINRLFIPLFTLPMENIYLAIIAFVNRCAGSALIFLSIFAREFFGFTIFQISHLMLSYGIGSVLGGIIGGKLTQYFNSIKIMITTLLISSIILFIYPFIHVFLLCILMTFLVGVVTECFRPANMNAIADFSHGEQRKLAYSINRLGINLGLSFGPVIVSLLAKFNMSMIFIANSITSFMAAILTYFFLIKFININKPNTLINPNHAKKIELSNIYKDNKLFFAIVSLILLMIVYLQHESTLPIFASNNLHLTLTQITLIFTLNTVLILAFEVPLNVLTLHWRHDLAIWLGGILLGCGFGSLIFIKRLFGFYLSVALWSFGEMILLPTLSTYFSEIAPEKKRGIYLGYFTSGFNISILLGPYLGLLCLYHTNYNTLWAWCFFLALIACILFQLTNVKLILILFNQDGLCFNKKHKIKK